MNRAQKILGAVIVLLLGLSIYGFWVSREPATVRVEQSAQKSTGASVTLVDQTPLLTARRLVQMPTSAEEKSFAEEALRIADHEMDLAFAAAIRDVEENPPVLSAQAKDAEKRLQEAEKALEADKARVAQLTAAYEKAGGERKDSLEDELDVAKAQQELDQDEVDDAKQDLIRSGGDPKGRIQAMIAEHEAASQAADSLHVTVSNTVEEGGLIHRFEQWMTLHRKQMLLWQAKQEAEAAAAFFSARHKAREGQMAGEKSALPAKPQTDPGQVTASNGPQAKLSREESAALVKATKRRSAVAKALASLDKRIDDQKQLAENYGKWIEAVAAKQRAVVHRALIGLTLILAILLIGIFFDSWLERLLGKTSLDRRQVETMRTVTRVSVQICAVLFILLVIFGPPGQLGTFLGLAGAGLTVALKDFIVGFIGWFVLMGKNGMRLGDWVEINGVTGEVVEIGPFHTVLLETGNWTDSGHPTGRRVTFTNSFAIEGHYFNFSTTGQWLWDELQVVLPSGKDPYPIVEAIRKKVEEETRESGQQAEQEWRSAASSRDMSGFSAVPSISVKPVLGGVEVTVRYIARANERFALRSKLNRAAVQLLGGKEESWPAQE
jgi:small-conductance mechanosensitive channel